MHEIGRNPKEKELNSTTRKQRVLKHSIMGSSIHTFVRSLVHTFALVLNLHISISSLLILFCFRFSIVPLFSRLYSHILEFRSRFIIIFAGTRAKQKIKIHFDIVKSHKRLLAALKLWRGMFLLLVCLCVYCCLFLQRKKVKRLLKNTQDCIHKISYGSSCIREFIWNFVSSLLLFWVKANMFLFFICVALHSSHRSYHIIYCNFSLDTVPIDSLIFWHFLCNQMNDGTRHTHVAKIYSKILIMICLRLPRVITFLM